MNTSQDAKRLTPTAKTLRELFLKSGNLCAFPNCSHLMMNSDGVFIGEICHIEAAEKGGERFNPNSTNEDRRHFDNLMLMCNAHHRITDDVITYTVDKLKKMKATHESRFSDPGKVMLKHYTDRTKANQPSYAENLNRFNTVFRLCLDAQEVKQMVIELRKYVDKLRKVPEDTRAFLLAVADRTYLMREEDVIVKSE